MFNKLLCREARDTGAPSTTQKVQCLNVTLQPDLPMTQALHAKASHQLDKGHTTMAAIEPTHQLLQCPSLRCLQARRMQQLVTQQQQFVHL
jgi:hypothetical protein